MEVLLWLAVILGSLLALFGVLAVVALLVYGAAHLLVSIAARLLTKITNSGRHSRN